MQSTLGNSSESQATEMSRFDDYSILYAHFIVKRYLHRNWLAHDTTKLRQLKSNNDGTSAYHLSNEFRYQVMSTRGLYNLRGIIYFFMIGSALHITHRYLLQCTLYCSLL